MLCTVHYYSVFGRNVNYFRNSLGTFDISIIYKKVCRMPRTIQKCNKIWDALIHKNTFTLSVWASNKFVFKWYSIQSTTV